MNNYSKYFHTIFIVIFYQIYMCTLFTIFRLFTVFKTPGGPKYIYFYSRSPHKSRKALLDKEWGNSCDTFCVVLTHYVINANFEICLRYLANKFLPNLAASTFKSWYL